MNPSIRPDKWSYNYTCISLFCIWKIDSIIRKIISLLENDCYKIETINNNHTITQNDHIPIY